MTDWVEVVAALAAPRLIALDVDGTLAPIVDDPGAARVPAETVALLRRLDAKDGVRVALVTGRDASSLSSVAPLHGVWRAVEHGAVLMAPNAPEPAHELEEGRREALEEFADQAREQWVDESVALEEKATSYAIHVRRLEDEGRAEAILDEAEQAADELGLHARRGRAVLEAEARKGDKASALRRLIAHTGAASVLYAGDDLTDVPAIELAAERGVGLFVTSPERPEAPEGASGALAGTDAVLALLTALADRL